MDLKRLRYFREIAKQGQITKAAKSLHMAQPPLSQQLRIFEEELNVMLFERKGRRLLLTEAGEALYQRSEHLLDELDELEKEIRETGLGLRGTLRLGAVKSCFAYLPERMKKFHKRYPNVSFSLRQGDSYLISELVKAREVEIGLIRMPLNLDNFDYYHLVKEPYVVVYPSSFQQFAAPSIDLTELATTPLLLLHRISGTGQYEQIIEAFTNKGLHPQILCECPDVSMLLSLVSSGLGVTIVPKSTLLAFQPPHTSVTAIRQTQLETESAFIWLRDRYLSKAALRFIESCIQNNESP
ncbi:DNA-binding transcriptional LysR family regulator [Alkalihalobacillus xiaoxiensis]|uniref:DNA-binding transcriptional LysR family regulator n=1 Tax=Shouchella xiaoxiensis TaxID=766895 RepID=A0ABS2SUU5_9BACI|nr:DNA-binding transcriptional LysR family regulator [Shouchella xiaoxiensis]